MEVFPCPSHSHQQREHREPRPGRRRSIGLVALAVAAALMPAIARAQVGSYRYSSIIVDDASGRVTEAVNADAPRYPASLTKLMTLYLVFEALRDHRIHLDQLVPISEHAASMQPTKLGVVPGSRLTVEDAILGTVTRSANDAACALGEMVGGSEERFAQMMTLRARALGMTHSTWRNASGLPDAEQVTTARDLALLAHHLIQDFPTQYHYFSVPSFTFHGHVIPNHDRMLKDYDGADGLKTGYTVAAGHNLVTSARRGNVRLIGVVMGASSNPERDIHMAALLDSGFSDLGVPVEPRASHFRLPSLIASAEAAPLHVRRVSYHVHGHAVHGHAGHAPAHRLALGTMPKPTLAVARGRSLAPTARARALAGAGGKTHHHGGSTYASRDARGT